MEDTFNKGNIVEGYVSVVPDVTYGQLEIETVNGKRLKYKIINPNTGKTMNHSYSKKNEQEWVKKNIKNRPYRIKKIHR